MKKIIEETKKEISIEVVLSVVKDGNKILTTIRRESKLKAGHMKVQLPGGTVKIGEELSKTAVREVNEETGWVVKTVRKLPEVIRHDWDYGSHIQHTIIHAFECEPVRESRSKNKRKMTADAKWYEIEEILTLDTMPATCEFIEHVRY